MTKLRPLATLLLAGAGLLASSPGFADDPATRPATFALIIGSNRSVDANVAPLKYADDDAAAYLALFRLLGARTYLLTNLDDNTRRLHPQAVAEASEPKRAALDRAIAQLASDVALARDRHVETTVYFVYAGHGDVDDAGDGYVTLEDARITGADLAKMIGAIPATRVHVIADACASYYLAYSRGPGGERRAVHGFESEANLASDPRVGLLLSTSSARESHEWDEYQAGVFSHEVRSGLYGAADADGDGRVSYREIAAFVARANAAIPNDRFRPDVHAKAPAGSETLMDLRHAMGRRLDVDRAHAGHYYLEDGKGARLLDFHNGPDQDVHIVRPAPDGKVFLRRDGDDSELVVPSFPDEIAIGDLAPTPARVAARGAAHEAFAQLFAEPFDRRVVETYREANHETDAVIAIPRDEPALSKSSSTRAYVGWSALGAGGALIGAGIGFSVASLNIAHGTAPSLSEAEIAARNARVSRDNALAATGYVVGGVALATGITVLLWPKAPQIRAAATPSSAYLGYGGSF